MDSVNDMTKGNDWFLVANDFADYMRAQVGAAWGAAGRWGWC